MFMRSNPRTIDGPVWGLITPELLEAVGVAFRHRTVAADWSVGELRACPQTIGNGVARRCGECEAGASNPIRRV